MSEDLNGIPTSSIASSVSSELQKLIAMAEMPLLNSLASSFASTSSSSSHPLTISSQTQQSAFLPVSNNNDSQQLAMLQLQMQLNALLPLLQQHISLQSNIPSLPLQSVNPTIDAINLHILQNQLLLASNPTPLLTDPAIFLPQNLPSTPAFAQPKLVVQPPNIPPPPPQSQPQRMQLDKSRLLPPKSPELRRRKRSRASAEPQVSVLRQLCDAEDVDVLKTSKAQNEEINRRKIYSKSLNKLPTTATATANSGANENKPLISSEEKRPLRKIFKEEDLPETVGPDSPLRHHPKYLNQNRKKGPHDELFQEFEAITTMFMMNGYMPDEMMEQFKQRQAKSSSAPASPGRGNQGQSPPRSECPMEDFMEQVISRELITCE